jgi:hypothetical protein
MSKINVKFTHKGQDRSIDLAYLLLNASGRGTSFQFDLPNGSGVAHIDLTKIDYEIGENQALELPPIPEPQPEPEDLTAAAKVEEPAPVTAGPEAEAGPAAEKAPKAEKPKAAKAK